MSRKRLGRKVASGSERVRVPVRVSVQYSFLGLAGGKWTNIHSYTPNISRPGGATRHLRPRISADGDYGFICVPDLRYLGIPKTKHCRVKGKKQNQGVM